MFSVVQFPGSNDDRDMRYAFSGVLGARAELVWHKVSELPAGTRAVLLPGGFSYGDYLRCGAMAQYSPVMAAVRRFAEVGGPVLGVCNGFQVLCEAGLLPGALLRNAGLHFVCDRVHVRVERSAAPFTSRARVGDVLRLPIKHGEGAWFAPPELADRLERGGRVLLRYCEPGGSASAAANPNGSLRDVAGLCNERGNVFGLMPHPEHAVEADLGGTDGLVLLGSLLDAVLQERPIEPRSEGAPSQQERKRPASGARSEPKASEVHKKTPEPAVDLALAREHGLSEGEYASILEILGRTPSFSELGIFSVMWSEHCSYKSSRKYLRRLPTSGPQVLQGPGENAGAVDLGDGLAAVFKIESHNHPSFIEPRQGAATGVGGILRDVFTMGARPVASLNSLRFGPLEDPKHRYLLHGVVAGIGGYGNPVGVATVGGEVGFHPCYRGNILVNAFNLGLVEADRLFRARASGLGNPVIYAGSKTGRDGIHGASLLASAEFGEGSEAKRPTVQVGDPFTEKCLIEACLELMAGDGIVGIQDMGAAGLTCSGFEMASNGGTGIELDLDRVPQREAGMTPYELLLSESQERMLLVARAGSEERVREVFARWDLDAVAVGRVVAGGRMMVRWRGETVVDIPVDPVAKSSPELDRPLREPADLGERQKLDLASLAPEADPGAALEALLDAPDLGSKAWIYRQYDQLVQGDTLIGPGGDAALVRVRRPDGTPTDKALALSVDCNPRWCWLDPYAGAVAAVAEAARNVACTGARPLALSNCLNFGNPEKPEIMWEFAETTRGLADAARALGTPVVSGNVSFYNETSGRAIYPTPTIAMVGLLEGWRRRAGSHFPAPGLAVVLLGETREELGGSAWLALRRGREAGRPPGVDLAHERRLFALLGEGVRRGLLQSAHDVADGGLAVALAECSFAGPQAVGARIALRGTLRPEALLFGESTGRVVVATAEPAALLELARQGGVPAERVGETGGERLAIAPRGGAAWIDAPLARLREVWRLAIPRRLQGDGREAE